MKRHHHHHPIRAAVLLGLVGLLASCATTKYVDEGSYLLENVSVRVDSLTPQEQESLGDLKSFLPQQPNAKFLGLFKWTLGVYNLSSPRSNSFLNRQLRRWGDPPVLYNEQEAEFGRANLTASLYNLGYFNAETTLHVDTTRHKRASLHYRISPGGRYQIAHHEEQLSDSSLRQLLHPADTLLEKRRYRGERYTSYLSPGSILSPQAMKQEQERIAQIFSNRGYYTFTADSVHFLVDTIGGKDSWVRSLINVPEHTWRIGSVRLIQRPSKPTKYWRESEVEGMHFQLDPHHYIRPRELAERIWIRPGENYSQARMQDTYNALSELPTISGVNILYSRDSLSGDSTLLNALITTLPTKTKMIGGELVGTNSSGSLGVSSSVSFLNSNLFHGGEELRLQLHGGYESFQGGRNEHRNYGAELGLTFPKLILPFLGGRGPSRWQSKTNFQVSYDHHNRPEFNRDIFSFDWGYSWHSYLHPAYRHQLKVIDLDFLHFGYINEEFRKSMPLITQVLNYRDQFVLGASYMLRYNSLNDYRLSASPWVHNLRLYVQSAGSLLYGMAKLLRLRQDEYNSYRMFRTSFAQFVKGEVDYSGLRKFGGGNALAYHLGLAVAYPFGNSRFVPVELRYFAGGANSLRGWTARTLGPGSMPHSASRSIFGQVGDIKLEGSLEYRMKVLGPLQLALFADGGNVWTIRPYENQPQGDFQWNRFYKEIALSSGLGLRWDFDYFVLRLDLGVKVYDPQSDEGQRWVISYKEPKDLLALNFAIGYPF